MDNKKKPGTAEAKKVNEKVSTTQFAFERENYKWMLIGLAIIVLGFLLMIGGGSDDPKVFNAAIFSFRRITLAPMLILAGYVVEIYAIMKRPRD
ncbi:MAG: DUF3098 domain-containing protein [Chloroflexota bacterium]|jgi:hypothetical protein|nr:DUF3098 domain-containing protein [Lentimicrobium sp.]